MSEFYDASDHVRERERVQRDHATRGELTEGTLDITALVLVAAGVLVLWWILK